jgi:hypothetical protein
MRRQFQLPEEDEECLNASGYVWETVIENNTRWLIIHAYPIPDGYNVREALLALRMPPSYPDEQIDMVYFSPGLALSSGRGIGALSPTTILGQQFQQWSRHRTAANPWRIGLDNVRTHLLQVDSWLDRELQKRAA